MEPSHAVELKFSDDELRAKVQVELLTAEGLQRSKLKVVDGTATLEGVPTASPALLMVTGPDGIDSRWLDPGVGDAPIELDLSDEWKVLSDADGLPIVGFEVRSGSALRATDTQGRLPGSRGSDEVGQLRRVETERVDLRYTTVPGFHLDSDVGHEEIVGLWGKLGSDVVEERHTDNAVERRTIQFPSGGPPIVGAWAPAAAVRLPSTEPWTPDPSGRYAAGLIDGTVVVYPRVFPAAVFGATTEARRAVTAVVEAGDELRDVVPRPAKAPACWPGFLVDHGLIVEQSSVPGLLQPDVITGVGGHDVSGFTPEQLRARLGEFAGDITVTVKRPDGPHDVVVPAEPACEDFRVGGAAPPSAAPPSSEAAVRTVHSSEVQVKTRIQPKYPMAAKDLNLGDVVCKVRIFIDPKGIPERLEFLSCPAVFQGETTEALLKWRFYPLKHGGQPVAAQFVVSIKYVLTD